MGCAGCPGFQLLSSRTIHPHQLLCVHSCSGLSQGAKRRKGNSEHRGSPGRDRSNITRMKLFAQCPAPGGTQYTELFFLFLWEATCLWKKEINMLYEQFSSPAGHRDVPESPALPCLPCPHPSCPCHLESGPEHKHVSAVLGDGDTQLPMERKYRGPRTERPVTEPHLLDRPANSSGLPQRDI